MLLKFKQIIKQQDGFSKGDRILVGVSGGVDSLCLLDILWRLSAEQEWELFAAHLNHQFRGEEAKEDALYVERFCRERNIPCEIGEANVPQLIMETQGSPQSVAREARFSFFRQVAEKWNINKLALAHHANDQAETVLMRILRGTGIEGLAGIHREREDISFTVVRPLLSIYKEELEAYCQQGGIIPRLDSSNLKKSYHRNFIRLEVIPWLEDRVNPSLQDSLNQLGDIAFFENEYLEEITKISLDQIIKFKEENKIIIKGKLFLGFHVALQRRMIKLIFNYLVKNHANIGFVHINQACEWIKEGRTSSQLELPHRVYAGKEYDDIIFTLKGIKRMQGDSYSYIIEIPGRTYIKEINAWISVHIGDLRTGASFSAHAATEVFNMDEIVGQLTLRSRCNGDRMSILGMDGTKKVKDILIDQKIPQRVRDQIPILSDDNGILWIPGVKRSNRAKKDIHTKKIITIHLEKMAEY